MPDSLGRGLESLIPNKKSEEASAARPVKYQRTNASLASTSASGTGVLPAGRTHDDHSVSRHGDSVFWIEVEKIDPNPLQPRRDFDSVSLKDLADSIREHGVLQPILVSKRERESPMGMEVRYQLIAGERRWRAAQLAGLSQMPAMIRRGAPDDRLRLELALIENVQREDLNPIERGRAFKRLTDEFHLVQREIANRVGKSREAVANTMRLLSLPEQMQRALEEGKITEGHGKALLIVDDPVKQRHLFQEILSGGMSVRDVEEIGRKYAGKTYSPRQRVIMSMDAEARMWQSRLQERLGTRVVVQKIGERGRIVVEFYSDEELRGIIKKIIHEA